MDSTVGQIIIRDDDSSGTRGYRVATHIGFGSAGKHNAGQIVVAEHGRAFQHARCNDDLLGANFMIALSCCFSRIIVHVIGQPFQHTQEVMVVPCADCRTVQNCDFGLSQKCITRHGDPSVAVDAIDVRWLVQQATAKFRLFIAQNNAGAAGACRLGRC